jgi:hypothetical protein
VKSILPGTAVLLIAALALTACTADPSPYPSFYTHLSLNDAGETIFVGEVRNAGYAEMRSMIGWHGVLEVRDEGGALVACQETSDLTQAIRPGDSDFPLRWSGRLAPGAYWLTWGSPQHGGVQTTFHLVQQGGAPALERDATTRIDGAAIAAGQSCAMAGDQAASR